MIFPFQSSNELLVSGERELRDDAWDLHTSGDLLWLEAHGDSPGKIVGFFWNMNSDTQKVNPMTSSPAQGGGGSFRIGTL